MPMNSANSNILFWNRTAKIYTALQERQNSILYDKVSHRISKYFNRNTKVLELACGTGQLTSRLCSKALSWEATDFSGKMVVETQKRFKKTNVNCRVEDATNLTYDNSIFDVVLIANALHIMPDPDKALKEIYRVLKPNGFLIAPTFVYDGDIRKFKVAMFERAGFKTFHKWKAVEYENFVEQRNFNIRESFVIREHFLPECVLVCTKSR